MTGHSATAPPRAASGSPPTRRASAGVIGAATLAVGCSGWSGRPSARLPFGAGSTMDAFNVRSASPTCCATGAMWHPAVWRLGAQILNALVFVRQRAGAGKSQRDQAPRLERLLERLERLLDDDWGDLEPQNDQYQNEEVVGHGRGPKLTRVPEQHRSRRRDQHLLHRNPQPRRVRARRPPSWTLDGPRPHVAPPVARRWARWRAQAVLRGSVPEHFPTAPRRRLPLYRTASLMSTFGTDDRRTFSLKK